MFIELSKLLPIPKIHLFFRVQFDVIGTNFFTDKDRNCNFPLKRLLNYLKSEKTDNDVFLKQGLFKGKINLLK